MPANSSDCSRSSSSECSRSSSSASCSASMPSAVYLSKLLSVLLSWRQHTGNSEEIAWSDKSVGWPAANCARRSIRSQLRSPGNRNGFVVISLISMENDAVQPCWLPLVAYFRGSAGSPAIASCGHRTCSRLRPPLLDDIEGQPGRRNSTRLDQELCAICLLSITFAVPSRYTIGSFFIFVLPSLRPQLAVSLSKQTVILHQPQSSRITAIYLPLKTRLASSACRHNISLASCQRS